MDTHSGDVPLKPVGCQVIEEAQPHRQRNQSVSSREQRGERHRGGQRRERPNYKRDIGGNGDMAASQSGGH